MATKKKLELGGLPLERFYPVDSAIQRLNNWGVDQYFQNFIDVKTHLCFLKDSKWLMAKVHVNHDAIQSFSLTPYKADPSLKWKPSASPNSL